MGQDKGLVRFLGEPLIQRVLGRLRPIADEVLVTTNRPEDYAFLGVRLAPDLLPGRGALGGLYTALSAASQPYAAVVACDMPFASRELLEALLERLERGGADLSIPRTEGGLEPFHAVYRRETCLPHILAALEAEKRRVDAWFARVTLDLVREEEWQKIDPEGLAFLNVNTPDELHQAEEKALSN